MRTAKNIIERKIKISNIISPQTLVIDALKMMIDINLSYLIVKDGDKYKGIFSERDYSRNVILKGSLFKHAAHTILNLIRDHGCDARLQPHLSK